MSESLDRRLRPIGRFVKRKSKQSTLFHALHPRRFQAFCIGAPKSGTHSMAELFRGAYRSEHEPQSDRLIPKILEYSSAQLTDADFQRYLSDRDNELWLEFEANHLLYYGVRALARAFPQARFILTIRDPSSWLESVVNQQYLTMEDTVPVYWKQMTAFMYPAVATKNPDHDRLGRYGLAAIEVFLESWAKHNREILSAVPANRLLILKTNSISESIRQIGAFVGVPPETLSVAGSRSFVREKKPIKLSENVDQAYLQDAIAFYCGDLAREIFGPQWEMTNWNLQNANRVVSV